jgi:hypothetical protein
MTVEAVRAAGATKTTAVTAMAGGTTNNQLKAIRGSRRNGGGSGSGHDGNSNRNSNSNGNGDGDSNNANANALRTPLKAIFAPPPALAE